MKGNNVGKTLHDIGIAIIVLGIIGSIFLSVNFDYEIPIILIVGAVSSFTTGMCFIGFSEIIALLQKSVNHQEEILSAIKNELTVNGSNCSPKTLLEDIEANLPKI